MFNTDTVNHFRLYCELVSSDSDVSGDPLSEVIDYLSDMDTAPSSGFELLNPRRDIAPLATSPTKESSWKLFQVKYIRQFLPST